jgi:hypothetical protein
MSQNQEPTIKVMPWYGSFCAFEDTNEAIEGVYRISPSGYSHPRTYHVVSEDGSDSEYLGEFSEKQLLIELGVELNDKQTHPLWWLLKEYPNDAELGAKVRELFT